MGIRTQTFPLKLGVLPGGFRHFTPPWFFDGRDPSRKNGHTKEWPIYFLRLKARGLFELTNLLRKFLNTCCELYPLPAGRGSLIMRAALFFSSFAVLIVSPLIALSSARFLFNERAVNQAPDPGGTREACPASDLVRSSRLGRRLPP